MTDANYKTPSRKAAGKEKIMEKIIGLWGAGNKGKTTTLNMLIEWYLKNPESNDIFIKKFPSNDLAVAFTWKGTRIVICTAGDYWESEEENIAFFKEQDADIFVAASRTKGGSVDKLEAFAKRQGIEIDWIEKTYAETEKEQAKANKQDMQTLLEKIGL